MGGAEGKDIPDSLKNEVKEVVDDDLDFPLADEAEERFSMDYLQLLVKALYKLPTLESFCPEEIGIMVNSTELYDVQPNEPAKRVICQDSRDSRGVFILMEGVAKVYMKKDRNKYRPTSLAVSPAVTRQHERNRRPDDEEILIQTLGRGDFFGEISTIFGQRTPASVDVLPGSKFAVVLKGAFPHAVLVTDEQAGHAVRLRLWCCYRAYIDTTDRMYMHVTLPEELQGNVPNTAAFSALSRLPVFKELPYHGLISIADLCHVFLATEGTVLFGKDQPGLHMLLVLTGTVVLLDSQQQRIAEFTATVAKPGLLMGEMEFWMKKTYKAHCLAASMCQIVYIERDVLLRGMLNMPEGAVQDQMKATIKDAYTAWSDLYDRLGPYRDAHNHSLNPDVIHHQLSQVPVFGNLCKSDFHDLTMAMTIGKYSKNDTVLSADSEKAIVLVSGELQMVDSKRGRQDTHPPGIWMWSRAMQQDAHALAVNDDVIVAEFPSSIVTQKYMKAVAEVEKTKGTSFLRPESLEVLAKFTQEFGEDGALKDYAAVIEEELAGFATDQEKLDALLNYMETAPMYEQRELQRYAEYLDALIEAGGGGAGGRNVRNDSDRESSLFNSDFSDHMTSPAREAGGAAHGTTPGGASGQ